MRAHRKTSKDSNVIKKNRASFENREADDRNTTELAVLRPALQGGFIISLTFILVLTIIGIGLLGGLAAVKNAWFKRAAFEASLSVGVVDANGVQLGKAVGFDEHETPLIPFVDYDVGGSGANYRVLIGVRDDRFTSLSAIYYTDACCGGPGCAPTGNTCIEPSSAGQNFQLSTQAGLSYAIGSTAGTLPGRLYRDSTTAQACDSNAIQSAWVSQTVIETEPCVSIATGEAPIGLIRAISVDAPAGTNVLDVLAPPFYTNLPINVNEFSLRASSAEGAAGP